MADIMVPNLFTKSGRQIPRSKYLNEQGYTDFEKLFSDKDGILKEAFKAFDKNGEPVDLERFHSIYRKNSLSDFTIANEYGYFLDLRRIVAFKTSPVAKKTVHATKFFKKEVEITDPCYPKEYELTRDRIAMPIKTGDYECVTWKHIEDGDFHHERVMIIGIYLNGVEPDINTAEIVGTIGVDTGTAGFFMNKPDYTDEEWERRCRRDFESIPGCYELPWVELMHKVHEAGIVSQDVYVSDEGFESCISWGDGGYDVIGYKEKGKFVAFEIIG